MDILTVTNENEIQIEIKDMDEYSKIHSILKKENTEYIFQFTGDHYPAYLFSDFENKLRLTVNLQTEDIILYDTVESTTLIEKNSIIWDNVEYEIDDITLYMNIEDFISIVNYYELLNTDNL